MKVSISVLFTGWPMRRFNKWYSHESFSGVEAYEEGGCSEREREQPTHVNLSDSCDDPWMGVARVFSFSVRSRKGLLIFSPFCPSAAVQLYLE